MYSCLNFSGCLILQKDWKLRGKSAHIVHWAIKQIKLTLDTSSIRDVLITNSEFPVGDDTFKPCRDYHDSTESWKHLTES